MTTRSIVAALVVALTLMAAAPASAQQAKCLAGKTACMAKKAAGLLKCEALAETPGKPADPNANECVTKVQTKFDGGLDPAKGCFEKLESKDPNDCLRFDDTAAAETAVDACVAAIVAAIDPPPRDQTKCGAGKKKCASKYLAALLKCRKLAQTPGKPTDPNTKGCVDKAVAKYTGGLEPTKGCFAKLQAKNPNDCQSTTNSLTVQGLTEDCVDDLVAVVAGTASTTSSTTPGATTTTTTTTIPTKDLCPPSLRCGSSCCGRFESCNNGTCSAACPPFGTVTCVPPQQCVNGECVYACGPVTCAANLGEICCSPSAAFGICCAGDSQLCSSTLQSCETIFCDTGETYVPALQGCCVDQAVCGSDGNGVGIACCAPNQFCDPSTVTCKLRPTSLPSARTTSTAMPATP
jgi:hypothetical protein